MPRPPQSEPAESTPHTLEPAGGGWHCSHLYYSFDRGGVARLSASDRAAGCEQFCAALDPADSEAPLRLQASIVSGHKADFGLMLLDPDPLKLDRVHQRLMNSRLGLPRCGPAIRSSR